jgi:hypothetical protein
MRKAAEMVLNPKVKEKVDKGTGEIQEEIPDEIFKGTPFEDDENVPF